MHIPLCLLWLLQVCVTLVLAAVSASLGNRTVLKVREFSLLSSMNTVLPVAPHFHSCSTLSPKLCPQDSPLRCLMTTFITPRPFYFSRFQASGFHSFLTQCPEASWTHLLTSLICKAGEFHWGYLRAEENGQKACKRSGA